MQYYYILGAFAYGIFILQTLLSFFAGDADVDVDFDGDVDGIGSDILSFKGLIHFLMGFSGWLMLNDQLGCDTGVWSSIIACGVGLLFMVLLYFTYKMCMKLQHTPDVAEGEQMVGKYGKVYMHLKNDHFIVIREGNEYDAVLSAPSGFPEKGDTVMFDGYKNGQYYITKNY